MDHPARRSVARSVALSDPPPSHTEGPTGHLSSIPVITHYCIQPRSRCVQYEFQWNRSTGFLVCIKLSLLCNNADSLCHTLVCAKRSDLDSAPWGDQGTSNILVGLHLHPTRGVDTSSLEIFMCMQWIMYIIFTYIYQVAIIGTHTYLDIMHCYTLTWHHYVS